MLIFYINVHLNQTIIGMFYLSFWKYRVLIHDAYIVKVKRN